MTDASFSDRAMAILRQLKLFSGVGDKIIAEALDAGDFEYREYAAGDTILSPAEKCKKAVIFLSGKAEVYSADKSRSVLLRTFEAGQVVGVANLFSNEDFVSRVIASKKCETLEISSKKYGKILESDPQAMYNYISFLSEKIRYLNRKIICLTAGSAERRLAYFLDTSIPDSKSDTTEITIQMNSLCDMLNLGRASLYRAADRLEEEGFITRNGKTIKVVDRQGMIKKYG